MLGITRRAAVLGPTELQRVIQAVRRNGGVLYCPMITAAALYSDSAGLTPITGFGDVVGRAESASGGAAAIQATTARKPTVSAQGFVFDGSNDFLDTGLTTSDEGWLCVGASSTNNSTFFANGAGSIPVRGLWFYRVHATNNVVLVTGNGSAVVTTTVGASMASGVPRVCEAQWSPAAQSVRVDGGAPVVAARSGSMSPPAASLRIGSYIDGATYATAGTMAAAIYCPQIPSDAEQTLLRRWVAAQQGRRL